MSKRRPMTRAETREGQQIRDLQITGIRAVEGEGNERRFRLSFSSEEPYERWWGTEILDHSDGAVDLDRLNQIGCLLYNHNRDKVIGRIEKAWIENGRGEAEVVFDEDAESEVIYQKVKSGTLKGVSVGYIVEIWEDVMANKQSADGKYTGPCSIARKWTPMEISIVSIPADPTVGVGRGADNDSKRQIEFCEHQTRINQNYYILLGGKL